MKYKCKCGEHKTQQIHFEEEMNEIEHLLIKNKIAYYHPELTSETATNDYAYDQFEIRYLQLCILLDEPNEFVHKEYAKIPDPENPEKEIKVHSDWNGTGMMEIDIKHPLVKEVLATMKKPKKKNRKYNAVGNDI